MPLTGAATYSDPHIAEISQDVNSLVDMAKKSRLLTNGAPSPVRCSTLHDVILLMLQTSTRLLG